MLVILVTVFVVFLVLVALLWLTTIWAQGYFYESPTDGLHWRAPAAAGALAAFFFLWLLIEWRRPNSTDSIFSFSSQRSQEFDRIISLRKGEDGEQEIVFPKRPQSRGLFEYRDDKDRRWARSMTGSMIAIFVEEKVVEGGEEKTIRRRFNAEMTPEGTFNPRKSGDVTMPLRYLEEGGDRFILEDDPGKVFSYRRGLLLLNLALNFLHLVVWFVVAWLLLRFQWPHALAIAAVAWLVVTLAGVPYMIGRARDAAEQRPVPKIVVPAAPAPRP